MDYEKKYKEAIEKVRSLHDNADEVSMLIDLKEELEAIFPELAESEDEEVRKALLEMVHDTTGDSLWIDYNVHKEDAIAWLEKQGDKDKLIKELGEYKVKYTQEVLSQQLEKKSEQKPTEWSEEDKRKIDRIYSILMQAADTHAFSTSCRLIGDKECIELQDFLKSLRPQKNNWERVTKEIYFKEPVLVRRKDKSDSWEGYRVCNNYTLNPQTEECYILIKDIK